MGDVYRVDAEHKVVDYASNEGNPLEQQIWQVSFDGERKQLSAGAGFHDGNFRSRWQRVHRQILLAHDAAGHARLPALARRRPPAACHVFWETHALDPYHLHAPEQLEVKAHDGTTLYATLLLPAGTTNPRQRSADRESLRRARPDRNVAESLEHDICSSTSCSPSTALPCSTPTIAAWACRGRAFAQAAYHNFGPVQLEDQLTVVDAALAKYPQLDPKRLGWWGWSWGGTFTLYAMTHSDRFRAGVAVAPVTDWRNYDSIYTERYLGLPAENPTAITTSPWSTQRRI